MTVFYGQDDKCEFSHFDLEFELQIETNKLHCSKSFTRFYMYIKRVFFSLGSLRWKSLESKCIYVISIQYAINGGIEMELWYEQNNKNNKNDDKNSRQEKNWNR